MKRMEYKGIIYKDPNEFESSMLKDFCSEKDVKKREELRLFMNSQRSIIKKEKIKKSIEDDLKFWKNLNTLFITHKDVPNIPLLIDHENVVIPALIRCGAIPKSELRDQMFYYGSHRNGTFAKWNSIENKFKVSREKFGIWGTDESNHFEDDDNFSLFVPLKEITEDQFNNRSLTQ